MKWPSADRESLENPARFVAFDQLYFDGHNILDWTLTRRLKALQSTMEYPPTERFGGKEPYAKAIAAGHEGTVAKRLDSPYMPGSRSSAWVKIKPQLDASRGQKKDVEGGTDTL
jgi:ATP-dependent DNA ligase